MPAVAIISAIASAATGVVGVAQSRSAAKDQKRAMNKQTQQARAAAALERPRTDTGAKVSLGTQDPAKARTTVASGIGGLSASSKLGL